jgi:hypothetical protein
MQGYPPVLDRVKMDILLSELAVEKQEELTHIAELVARWD